MASRSVSVTPSAHRLEELSPLSILLLASIGAKLVDPHGGGYAAAVLDYNYAYILKKSQTKHITLGL